MTHRPFTRLRSVFVGVIDQEHVVSVNAACRSGLARHARVRHTIDDAGSFDGYISSRRRQNEGWLDGRIPTGQQTSKHGTLNICHGVGGEEQ